MDGMAADEQYEEFSGSDGDDVARLRNGDRADEVGLGSAGDDLGAWVQGLSPTERAVIDRAAAERDLEAGRRQLGRYARSHPGALREGDDGGRLDADGVLDFLIEAAAEFSEEDTTAADHERVLLRAALDEAITKAARRPIPDPNIATFCAYIPNGGIKTNRDNEYVLTLHVAWEGRHEVHRVIDTIPMTLNVTLAREEV